MVHSDSVNLKSRSNIAIVPLGKQSEDEIRLKSYKSLRSELVDVVQVIAWCHTFTTQCWGNRHTWKYSCFSWWDLSIVKCITHYIEVKGETVGVRSTRKYEVAGMNMQVSCNKAINMPQSVVMLSFHVWLPPASPAQPAPPSQPIGQPSPAEASFNTWQRLINNLSRASFSSHLYCLAAWLRPGHGTSSWAQSISNRNGGNQWGCQVVFCPTASVFHMGLKSWVQHCRYSYSLPSKCWCHPLPLDGRHKKCVKRV